MKENIALDVAEQDLNSGASLQQSPEVEREKGESQTFFIFFKCLFSSVHHLSPLPLLLPPPSPYPHECPKSALSIFVLLI